MQRLVNAITSLWDSFWSYHRQVTTGPNGQPSAARYIGVLSAYALNYGLIRQVVLHSLDHELAMVWAVFVSSCLGISLAQHWAKTAQPTPAPEHGTTGQVQ